MSQEARTDLPSCPTFENLCQKYISDATNPNESAQREEEIRLNRAEFYKRALEAKSFKCNCNLCFRHIWNLNA